MRLKILIFKVFIISIMIANWCCHCKITLHYNQFLTFLSFDVVEKTHMSLQSLNLGKGDFHLWFDICSKIKLYSEFNRRTCLRKICVGVSNNDLRIVDLIFFHRNASMTFDWILVLSTRPIRHTTISSQKISVYKYLLFLFTIMLYIRNVNFVRIFHWDVQK